MKNGFTLIEVLVAVILVGLTITAFFELLAGSLRLEYKVQQKVGLPSLAKQAFDRLLEFDVTDDHFPWEGIAAGHPYELKLYPIELSPNRDESQEKDDDKITITLPQELFEYVFLFYEDGTKTKPLRLVRYKGYSLNHFDEDFLGAHLSAFSDTGEAAQ